MKKLLTFIKHDFVSQVFSLTLILAIIYFYFLFNDTSLLTKLLILASYNELKSIHDAVTYDSLSRLIDLGVGAAFIYGIFMTLLGFSCVSASKENFKTPSSNIEVLTGHKPDFIHYRITRSTKTLMTLKDWTFCYQGLVRNESVVGYHDLYNYLKEQNMRFNALTDDDFLIMNMVKI